TIADPSGATASSAVTVTVHPVNDAPIAVDDRFETTQSGDPIREDNPIIISRAQLIANDIDFDGDPLTLTGVRNAFGGKATLLDNQTVLFEPNADFFGEARFEYRIDDGQGGIDWGTATIVYQAVNDRPVARDDRYTDPALYILRGVQDTPLVIPILELLKNDYDVEGFAVTFQNATGGGNGDVVRVGDDLVFTPDPGYFGEATFGYSITDPEGDVDGGFVTLYFRPTSSAAPVAVADRIFVAEDIPTVIRLSTLLANDTDVDLDELQIIGWRPLNGLGDFFTFGPDAVGPLNGTLELNADGDLLFTPNIDATFSSGFVYLLTDNADGTVEGFVDIVILPSNDDPTAVEDTGFVTPFGVPLVIRVADLLFNDFDIEQADRDGDGIRDDDLDDPDRARPSFVGVDAVLDPAQLARGNRVSVGSFEVITFRGEHFVVVRFEPGFSGPVTIEYRIADAEGLQDTGLAHATVADFYGLELSGSPLVDYIEGTALDERIFGLRGHDWIIAGAGNDTIEAGEGDDLIQGGDGDDVIDAGDGADTINGGNGFDMVRFGASNTGVRADLSTALGQGGFAQGDFYISIEALEGTAFSDTLGGGAGNDLLIGLSGNDLLEGRGGSDTLLGGAGHDS
ncbi:MAG TPA: Ig-like domain-containing protein, partial [Novosphingobium sp.]|nr:Ig-like domain-containing protein [Novosphingobium sp.]